MPRRALVVLLLLAAMSGLRMFGHEAPDPASNRLRIAVLMSQDLPPYRDALGGFQKQLEELRVPFDLDIRRLGGKAGLDRSLEGIDAARFDLVLALGTPATKMATGSLTGTPVVSALALRSADLGPPDDMTGVFLEFPVNVELQWIRRLLPGHKRVGVIYSRALNQERMAQASRVADSMSLQLIPRPVDGPREIPDSLASLENEAEVLWGVADDTVLTPQTATEFLTYSLRNRMPFVGLSLPWVKAGALYALDRDYTDVGRQCGEMAARILRGERVASVHREPPRKVVYAINLRTAQRMTLRIPSPLLQGAIEVIE